MKTLSTHQESGSELRALLSFYGTATAGMIVLRALAVRLLPATCTTEYRMFIWTLSFAIACGVTSWLFERHRQSAGH